MSTRAVVSVSATTGLLESILEAGGNPDGVLHTVGLERSDLADPDRSISSAAFARLLDEASRDTADDFFGLHFGEHFDPKNAGALAFVMANSRTIAIALENIERYFHMHNNEPWISFAIEGDRAFLRYGVAGGTERWRRQHHEYSMTVLLGALRMLAGPHWAPREIHFVHEAPVRTSEHSRIFGCRVLFAAVANAIVFERDFVERPMPAADEKLYRVLKRYVERMLADTPRHDDLPGVVSRAIGEAMAAGEPNLERIAARLAVSPRTLERRLKNDGTSYRALLEETRSRFAVAYLRNRRQSLSEIAFLLGYSEVSAFNRAFKRWTGSTPSEYRGS